MAKASGYGYIDLTSPGSSFKHTKFWRPKPNGVDSSGGGNGDSRYTITEGRQVPPEGAERPTYRDVPMYDLPDRPEFEVPEFKTPEMYNVPDFEKPEYDEGEVKSRARKKAAPYLRTLRSELQRASTQQYENPNVRSMSLRDAMTGYGQGLESIMAGAESQARAEYGQEYAMDYESAKINYQSGVELARDEYETLMTGMLSSWREKTGTAKEKWRSDYAGEAGIRRDKYISDVGIAQQEYKDAWDDYMKSFTTQQTTRLMTEKEIRDAEREARSN